ncbi:MAG TPA: hypothetical protein VEJ39_04260 [Candidatus Acidoferrales bacterium]|nr:hypothetical protein [Candidatus Acidoferrales bacterium]
MARHGLDAGSCAPATILVDKRLDGVHLTYERMARLPATYGNTAPSKVARDLDVNIETLLKPAASEIR